MSDDDMTGWIMRYLEWERPNTGWRLKDTSRVYLVLGPVPTRRPWLRWTLLDMNDGRRLTFEDKFVRSTFNFRRLA